MVAMYSLGLGPEVARGGNTYPLRRINKFQCGALRGPDLLGDAVGGVCDAPESYSVIWIGELRGRLGERCVEHEIGLLG